MIIMVIIWLIITYMTKSYLINIIRIDHCFKDCVRVSESSWLDKWTASTCPRTGHLCLQTEAHTELVHGPGQCPGHRPDHGQWPQGDLGQPDRRESARLLQNWAGRPRHPGTSLLRNFNKWTDWQSREFSHHVIRFPDPLSSQSGNLTSLVIIVIMVFQPAERTSDPWFLSKLSEGKMWEGTLSCLRKTEDRVSDQNDYNYDHYDVNGNLWSWSLCDEKMKLTGLPPGASLEQSCPRLFLQESHDQPDHLCQGDYWSNHWGAI